ncbi:MAG: HlyD family efflux transporter periplasmic adaptor subunit [Candidatus Brocadiia bacterium]|nr:MAG: HlyD family efflux transporter periplasmic adaptor subunit [Candidatus Brocadiia bacterium]
MNNSKKMKTRSTGAGRIKVWLLILVCAIVLAVGLYFVSGGLGKAENSGSTAGTYKVKRGDLTISVTENGDIRPLYAKNIQCEVEGKTTIISIVDEGTIVTPEDVKNGKVLIELDSSSIKERLTTQEITYLSADASFTEAKEALDIQKKQNDSDIESGRLKVRFALMDLQKYLGEAVANKLLSIAKDPAEDPNKISGLISDPELGGEALQMLRVLESNIQLTGSKLLQARDKYEGTKELFENSYVAEIELKRDELEVSSGEIQQNQDATTKELFVKYGFPKQAEFLLSGYYESQRELDRIEAGARSKLAQAQAKLGSNHTTYLLQKERLEKLKKQFNACIIRAPAPGEVIYASRTDDHRSRSSTYVSVAVGTDVQERQKLISIPDTSQMKILLRIHETWIDKIQLGQRASIAVSAFPEERFSGKVIRKAPLADPPDYMNPDLKVYTTEVLFDKTDEVMFDRTDNFIKTGMSAKVEIIVEKLNDILSVPIQAVINDQGRKLCYVVNSSGPRPVEVQPGAFNDNFVEIKNGLKEGDDVMLNPPRGTGADERKKTKPEPEIENGDQQGKGVDVPEREQAGPSINGSKTGQSINGSETKQRSESRRR